jgi:hypothetical protein
MKLNQTMAEFIADQILTAPEQTYKILSLIDDGSSEDVQALKTIAKTQLKSAMRRSELILEINRRCPPIPELTRCPHTPDLFD